MSASGDDNDSRTASVGLQRNLTNGSNNSSRRSSHERSRKKQKRVGDRDVRDFVPQGATFSGSPLEVDPKSPSGSDTGSSDGEMSVDADNKSTASGPNIAVDENQENAARTSSNEEVRKDASGMSASQFHAVNDKYWRSRSASASSDEGEISSGDDSEDLDDDTSSSGSSHLSDDSADSDSMDSEEADDSIMVNVDQNGGLSQGSEYDPESRRVIEEGLFNGTASDKAPEGSPYAQSKEDALHRFSQKYPTAPSTLVDLDRHDFEVQARYLFFDRDINDVNLDLPVGCIECLQTGHLSEVCPSKECVHCGAWNQHQSSFCPSWRRCQKCRERGHDEKQCPQIIMNDVSQIPCDFCGHLGHIEFECDQIWKFPQKAPSSTPVLVSISCANCTSNRHLIGDCPSLRRPLRSSSWTLKHFDPEMITNLNSVVPGRRRGGGGGRGQGGMKIRGRAQSPTSSSDELPMRGRQPLNRNATRPSIQIGKIGRGKNVGRGGSQAQPFDNRSYRDRRDFGNNTRQRSLSPVGLPERGRAMDSWKPPPSRGRGNGDRGGRGRGRGGSKRGGNGDSYRPLPSAAKKNWDRFRL